MIRVGEVRVPGPRTPNGYDPRFQPHVLVITDPGDGLEKEWDVEHPDDCPRSCFWWPGADEAAAQAAADAPLLFTPDDFDCYVQYELFNVGLDGLEVYSLEGDAHLDPGHVPTSEFEAAWHRLRPGRYRFEGWYSPGESTPYGPAEPDGGLILLEAL